MLGGEGEKMIRGRGAAKKGGMLRTLYRVTHSTIGHMGVRLQEGTVQVLHQPLRIKVIN